MHWRRRELENLISRVRNLEGEIQDVQEAREEVPLGPMLSGNDSQEKGVLLLNAFSMGNHTGFSCSRRKAIDVQSPPQVEDELALTRTKIANKSRAQSAAPRRPASSLT